MEGAGKLEGETCTLDKAKRAKLRQRRRRGRGGEQVERVEASSIKRRGSPSVLSHRLEGESRSCVQLSQTEERPSGAASVWTHKAAPLRFQWGWAWPLL